MAAAEKTLHHHARPTVHGCEGATSSCTDRRSAGAACSSGQLPSTCSPEQVACAGRSLLRVALATSTSASCQPAAANCQPAAPRPVYRHPPLGSEPMLDSEDELSEDEKCPFPSLFASWKALTPLSGETPSCSMRKKGDRMSQASTDAGHFSEGDGYDSDPDMYCGEMHTSLAAVSMVA
eukprot:gnl/TRDRNA2_/TRDRNA2_33876_c0_seq1.p1 gnl/TRDRNA2_/TRDRNA2_33876_c0~~gnl/TRDRNA2_/TRDRNA2_33876_c0_seq1.p1  ORF type:complete len:191 (-),score=10.96 gnl/TRDRNA2_/TRDRNA2_33876_c0_seq1:231-767(-)